MMTVREVSQLTGVSVRTLHHYDQIGLLPPAGTTEAGYRLYDDASLERLQYILLFRALEFPLKDIAEIIDSPTFDRNRALEQQIHLLELKKEHLENLIDLARGMQMIGVKPLNFSVFDPKQIDAYAREAKASWGQSPEWREYEVKSAGRTQDEAQKLGLEMMGIFEAIGARRETDPASPETQALVARLRDFISANYYACNDETLCRLGMMYAGGGRMTENIDRACGEGAGAYAGRAIEIFTKKNQ